MERTLQPGGRLQGVLKVPGDKSISHRALILGAIARGRQVVEGLADSRDVARTIDCLRKLGCFVETMPDGRTLVLSHEISGEAELDAGNSGTTARLIAGLVAGMKVTCTIDGDASLRRRPMGRIAQPLSSMGAKVTLADGDTLPMTINGGRLEAITFRVPVASAQVKSAVLIAGLLARGTTTVTEDIPTRDHTEIMLRAMAASVTMVEGGLKVEGGCRLAGSHITIPGDVSSAACFIAATCCLPGSEMYLPVTGVNPTRTGFLDALKTMGASIDIENRDELSGEPVGDLVVRSSSLLPIALDDPTAVVSMIDELPLLAVVATQASGTTVVHGASELRKKESDRITAIVQNLTAMGAIIHEHDDGFTVEGPSELTGCRVRSYGDHRIAMAMVVASLLAKGETTLDDDDVIAVSYPGFFNDLRAVLR